MISCLESSATSNLSIRSEKRINFFQNKEAPEGSVFLSHPKRNKWDSREKKKKKKKHSWKEAEGILKLRWKESPR